MEGSGNYWVDLLNEDSGGFAESSCATFFDLVDDPPTSNAPVSYFCQHYGCISYEKQLDMS
jgi:hypothetical protein